MVFTTVLFTFMVMLVGTIYIWLKYRYTYWKRHRIPFASPALLLGNVRDLLLQRKSFGSLFYDLYNSNIAGDVAVLGIYIFHTPAVILRDPDLIQSVLIKNFNTFLNRYEAADQHDTFGSLILPLAKYPIWRESRKRISEYFTTGNMKGRMYPLMLDIAHDLENRIVRHLEREDNNPTVIEVKEMCTLFTIDLTALLSFGKYEGTLQRGTSAMRQQCFDLLKPTFMRALHFITVFFLPQLTSCIRAKVFTQKYMAFMRQEILAILDERTKSKSFFINGDLIDILLKFKRDSKQSHLNFTQHLEFLPAQAAIFLLAGFETSSSLISFTLYELAKQPLVQDKLRLEIAAIFVNHGNKSWNLPYERMSDMSYLNMVVAEALRLYPAAAFINRECTPPPHEHGFSLKPYADFVVPRGMPAYISILGLHRDPKYWPNPEYFDPERFAPGQINSHHPMSYIPFGSGPHGCIGSRLALLQVKLGLVYVLKKFSVEVCDLTPDQIKFDPASFMLQAKGGIYLRFVKNELMKERSSDDSTS